MSIPIQANIIETVNKVVRTSRQMLSEIGREPTPEELAEKVAMPVEKVRKVLKIATAPIKRSPRTRRRFIIRLLAQTLHVSATLVVLTMSAIWGYSENIY